MRSGLVAVGIIALFAIAAVLALAQADHAARGAAAGVHEGQSFAEAEQRLVLESRRHTRCVGTHGDEHLFWYGLPIKQLAAIVYVQTSRRPDGDVVLAVATEPDYVLLAADSCG